MHTRRAGHVAARPLNCGVGGNDDGGNAGGWKCVTAGRPLGSLRPLQAVGADGQTASRARRKCAISLCTCGALDSPACRRSTAALGGRSFRGTANEASLCSCWAFAFRVSTPRRAMCRRYASGLPDGTEWVLALYPAVADGDLAYRDEKRRRTTSSSSCGEFAVRVDNGSCRDTRRRRLAVARQHPRSR